MSDAHPWKREVALVVVLAGVVLLPLVSFRDLWGPDEARYMEVAREMVVTGDYLVPHLNGDLYPDKPPVFFWLAAGFYHLGFGYNSGRVVAALAAIGTVLLVYFLARRMMPRPGPVISALVTLTVAVFAEAKAGVIDPVLTFFIVASLMCGYLALQPETRRRALWWLGAYGLAALAVLTKGPVGFLLPALPALVVLGYGLVNRRRVRAGGWVHLAGALVFVAVVAAWLVPALVEGGPSYSQNIGLDQTLKRVVKSSSHRQPFYYYLARFPMDFFPWAFVFPLAFAGALRRWRRGRDEPAQFLVLWFALIFVFFTLISGKRQGYLMPLVPAVGLLIGRYISLGLSEGFRWPRWHDALFRVTFVVWGLVGAVFAVAALALPALVEYAETRGISCPLSAAGLLSWEQRAPVAAAGVVMLAAAVYGMLAARTRTRHLRTVACVLGLFVFLSLVFDVLLAPKINLFKSARPFCDAVKPYLDQADRVHLFPNNMSGVHNLYTGRVSMPVLERPRDLIAALSGDSRVAVIGRLKRLRKALKGDSRYPIAVQRRVGSHTAALAINWDPKTGKPSPPVRTGVRTSEPDQRKLGP